MVQVIDGVLVDFPRKLESRLAEIRELVGMVKELSARKGESIEKIRVWENKRHELCYADFTERPVKEPTKEELLYVCDKCLCRECVRKSRDCFPCMQCNNKPKSQCPMSRRFDPELLTVAKILARKKDCLHEKQKGCNGVCKKCELWVTDGELLSAVVKSQTLINNIHHYIVVERFEEKLLRETTVEHTER